MVGCWVGEPAIALGSKPFHKNELVARILAIVRRSKGHAQSVIHTGDLVVNLDTKPWRSMGNACI
jgi:two-component system, cell cycle response regulator CtrA